MRSGKNKDDGAVVGVSGAEAVEVGCPELLEPPKEVIDLIENRFLLLVGAVVVVVVVVEAALSNEVVEGEVGRGCDCNVGVPEEVATGDGADEVDAVTPATIEDEIL